MAQWSDTTKHSADSFNGGNQYTKNDQMSIEALNNNIENSLYAVRVAENVQSGANNPVSYNSQTPTSAEQNQARKNIGVDRLFVEQGVADINNCTTYDELYTALANSPNGTGIGDIGTTAQTPLHSLLPTFYLDNEKVPKVMLICARIIAGSDISQYVIECCSLTAVSNAVPTYKLQIRKDNNTTVAGSWANSAKSQSGIVTWNAERSHTQTITFPEAFSSVPTVVCTAIGVDAVHTSNICGLAEVTATSFTVAVYGFGSNDKSIGVHWIAIGG